MCIHRELHEKSKENNTNKNNKNNNSKLNRKTSCLASLLLPGLKGNSFQGFYRYNNVEFLGWASCPEEHLIEGNNQWCPCGCDNIIRFTSHCYLLGLTATNSRSAIWTWYPLLKNNFLSIGVYGMSITALTSPCELVIHH